MTYYKPIKPHEDCGGSLVYIDDEYNGLAGGGDYEIWRCDKCGKFFYLELPD